MTFSVRRFVNRRFLAAALTITAMAPLATAMAASENLAWQSSRQMVLVITPDWNADHGVLRAYERNSNGGGSLISANSAG